MLPHHRVDVLYVYMRYTCICTSIGQVQRFLAALVCVAAANLEDCEIEERLIGCCWKKLKGEGGRVWRS